jgi:hypothetical protein
MDMITKETRERLQPEEVEYRVNKQAVEKKPATYLKGEIEKNELRLNEERLLMEILLRYEVKKWEMLFWKKLKACRDQIGDDREKEKGRLTMEWRANCWKRLNAQMHAAQERWAEFDDTDRDRLSHQWASSIAQLFGGVDQPFAFGGIEHTESISLSRGDFVVRFIMNSGRVFSETHLPVSDEICPRIEDEMDDIEFRLRLGSDLGRFNLFWDDDCLFNCRYSRSKWLYLKQDPTIPLEIYSRALKRNKNITHIDFDHDFDVKWIQTIICDLPWVTSISRRSGTTLAWTIHRDLLFIGSTNNDLVAFAKEIRPKLDPFSTYIFTDFVGFKFDMPVQSGSLTNARVVISFVAPSGQSLVLRLKHSGSQNGALEVTLGPTMIQLNSSSMSDSLLTIDDITLHPMQDPRTSESDSTGLSFEPGDRNDIIIDFFRSESYWRHSHLHDIELLDESGLEKW